MFIDIHAHTRRLKGFPRENGTTYPMPEEIIAAYDKANIEKGVILPLCSPEGILVVQSNEDILEIADKSGGRLIPFCNIDPRFMSNRYDAPLEKMLEYYKQQGCRGIGEVTTNLRFTDPFMQNLFRAAEKTDMPLTFHLATQLGGSYGIAEEKGLTGLEETLKRFPKLKLLGHSQPFWAEISENPSLEERNNYPKGKVREGRVAKLMRKYPNLYGDLSAGSGFNALNRDREYAVAFLNEFQDRLLFGTDMASPDANLRTLSVLLEDMTEKGEISECVFKKITRENALKLLGL